MAWSRLLVVSVLALLGALATHVAPAAAQKKISVLTWNIPIYKEKIGGWIADFKHHLAVEARKEGIGRSPRTAVRLYFRGQDLVLPAPLQLGADR